mgnify:CR=1 FL=1
MLKLVNSLKYPNLIAKLKGMNAKNLNSKDFEELLKQNNIVSINSILKTKSYHLENLDDNSSREEIENELDNILIDDIEKIEKYLSNKDKEILFNCVLDYEIKVFMDILKKIKYGKIEQNKIDNINKWTSKIFNKLQGIARVNNINEIKIYSKKTAFENIINSFLDTNNIEESNLFLLEMQLDKFYFENLFNNLNTESSKKLIGTKIDLENIIWIYRMKKYYNMPEEEIKKYIIEVDYNLKCLNELIAIDDYKQVIEFLKKTKYKEIFETENENLEILIRKYMYNQYKKTFRQAKYDISTVISYLGMDKNQIENIINIVGGVEYKIDKQKIQEKIII